MTTLYREVLIESAEQAEALPEGTIATVQVGPAPYYKFDGRWHWGADGGFAARSPVGMTALVPIEAEEEWKPDMDAIPPWPEPTPDPFPGKTRYVTPWTKEEAWPSTETSYEHTCAT